MGRAVISLALLVANVAIATEHWAFLPPRRANPPASLVDWPASSIDAFVLEELLSHGQQPASLATRNVLARRLSFDVRGMPPEWPEVASFLADEHPQAYERLLDRWLASPAYGERQAQHWLDLARYADTTGYAADKPRTMWLFRDWVIDALNANLPYDQFTVEQLAGDLLPHPTEAQRIASGFHANAPQALADNLVKEEFRVRTVVDRLNVTGQVWLGLTLACAECHDHKTDPISTREYYQMFAIFNNVPHHGEDWEVHGPRLEVQRVQAQIMAESAPRETRVHLRGDYRQPGERVAPGVPAFLPPLPAEAKPDRLALANWLVNGQHPLTARVAVNRLWQHCFGQALVATANDFGKLGEPPSHPALLDWLAVEFVARGWDQKALLREILCSATYRQSSACTAVSLARDPANRWLGRGPRGRLPAEQIRDQAQAVSGLLVRQLGGSSVYPPQPESVGSFRIETAGQWHASTAAEAHRRSLYTFWQRMAPYPTLAILGAPSREVCQVRRAEATTPMQALVTLNDPTFHAAARALAERLTQEAASTETRVRLGFRLCLAREPSTEEAEKFAALANRRDQPNAWLSLAAVLLNLHEALAKE